MIYIGTDSTGVGLGFLNFLYTNYFRETVALYNKTKEHLVPKMIDVIDSSCLYFDAEHKDIAMALMTIKRMASGNRIILKARAERSTTDAFLGIAHALINKSLNTAANQRKSTFAFGHLSMIEYLITPKDSDENQEENFTSVYRPNLGFETIDISSWMLDYRDLYYNDKADYWEPPINPESLSQLAHANAYHGSLLTARANYVAGRFKGGGNIRRRHLQQFTRDYIQFGHGALLKLRDRVGRVMGLYPLPAMYLRKRRNGDFWLLELDDNKRKYKAKDVIWLPQYDPKQQVYGLPDYVGVLQSTLLNKNITLFRRRYYKNGAHMGYILYSTDPKLSGADEKKIIEMIASSKGLGSFRSMFINIHDDHVQGIQLNPAGDIVTKDEFSRIKSITAQDIFISHRFPPSKLGIVPTNTSGFSDPEKVGREYLRDETIPVCKIIMDEINSDPEIVNRKDLRVEFDVTLPVQD
nr:phage portal protein [Candidatus Enterovibrio escacola]